MGSLAACVLFCWLASAGADTWLFQLNHTDPDTVRSFLHQLAFDPFHHFNIRGREFPPPTINAFERDLRKLSQIVEAEEYYSIVDSISQLSVNLTFGEGIGLWTRRGYFTAKDFPSKYESNLGDEVGSTYRVKRVDTEDSPEPSECSLRNDTNGQEVPCLQTAKDEFTCQRNFTVVISISQCALVTLTTHYRSIPSPENSSVCVQEVAHDMEISFKDSPEPSEDLITTRLKNVIGVFHRIHIHAELESTQAAGAMHFNDSCGGNCSAENGRRAWFHSYYKENTISKGIVLVNMAFTSLIEHDFAHSNEIYCLCGFRRTYPNMLMKWTAMKRIDLSSGGFSYIDDDYFTELPELTAVSLARNSLMGVPVGIQNIQNLQELDLSDNPLENMEQLSEVLRHLKMLEDLNLSGVPVRRVESLQGLAAASNLRSLTLRRSQLSSITSKKAMNLFASLTRLERLDLSENPLFVVKDDAFSEMYSLKYLDLSHTNLRHSISLTFPRQVSIDIINLSHNQLTSIDAINTCGIVVELKLDHNLIEGWSKEEVFVSSCKRPWLKFLNISNNRIQEISSTMRNSLDNLTVLDMGQNPLTCDCHMKEVLEWVSTTKLRILSMEPLSHETCVVHKKNCEGVGTRFYWYLLIPVAIGLLLFLAIKICTSMHRYQIAYLEHLDLTRKENRKKAVLLAKVAFENDVYIVHSLQDEDWVHRVLLSRLDEYRVFVADPAEPNGKDLERIDHDIRNSRHVLFVLSDAFRDSEYCMHRGLDIANIAILDGANINLIFVMLPRVNQAAFPSNLKLLTATYDSIDWPEEGKSDKKACKKLFSYLGSSTNEMWKINFENMTTP